MFSLWPIWKDSRVLECSSNALMQVAALVKDPVAKVCATSTSWSVLNLKFPKDLGTKSLELSCVQGSIYLSY